MNIRLSEIARAVNGKLIGNDKAIATVSIDTRSLKPGDLYVAIQGKQFDGNKFIDKAEAAGASAAILTSGHQSKLPHILVADTRLALGQLASAWRAMATAEIVGITGSNGKTTVKEMTAAILAVAGPVMYTQGNLNNDFGVPLTLLRLNEDHRYAVIEMGANHLGEIAYVNRIADADVVILNNAGAAHLEGFGSLDGVAKGKGEIIETLKQEGIAVLNYDDRYFDYWCGLAGVRRVVSFGLSEAADVHATNIKTGIAGNSIATGFGIQTKQGSVAIHLKLAGMHNVMNALAAAAAALALGLSLEQVKQGLESVSPVTGRLQPLVSRAGSIIIDDTYNANASSLQAGLDVLVNCQGQPWVVLGAFAEMGEDSGRLHQEIGELIKSKGVVRLLAIGPDAENSVRAFGKGATFFNSQEELIAALKAELKGGESVLVKGSRTQRMENVAAALVDNFRA